MKNIVPIVIIPYSSWFSPELPAKHRFEYKTEVNIESGTITLTVTVMKRSRVVKFFLGRDQQVKSLSREMPRDYPVQGAAHAMELQLKKELFPEGVIAKKKSALSILCSKF